MIPFGDDVSVKTLTAIAFLALGTRPALWVDGVLTAPTSSSFLSSIGAAPLASPAFTGVPTAPTAAAGTNTTQVANTAFVRAELALLVGSVPSTLDTLDELAAALGDDPNFATTIATQLGGKVSKSGDTMTGDLTFGNDGLGVALYGGARIYKKAGTGIVTRLHSANTRMQVENNAGSILGTYWDSGNLPVSAFMQGVLNDVDGPTARTSIGAQAEIYKTVFQTANGAPLAGWVRLGTLTGDNQSRFEIKVTGKQGWNDQNFPGQAILHGSTNYIGADTGQIAAGCKWIESTGSSTVATEFALVRQAGYASSKFDLYVLLDAGFVGWLVEVTTMGGSGWVTSVAYNQTNPGTGTNVFKPTRRVIWDSSWVASPIGGTGTVGAIPKFSAATTLANSLLADTGTEIQQSSGVRRWYNPNLTDAVFAFTRGTAGTPDSVSAFVAYMNGKFEWGPGGSTARDNNLYRLTANMLKTDGAFMAAGGFRSVNYETTALNGTGPGVEVHYDIGNSRARILGYNRTTSSRVELAIDGAPINFYANGVIQGAFSSAGLFSLQTLTAGRALISDGSKNVYFSATTAAQIGWLSNITGDVQGQLNGKTGVAEANIGTTMESVDPFTLRGSYDVRGGVRTVNGAGPFGSAYYNMVDVRHRNAMAAGDIYGGELVWGMTGWTDRLAFRSRAANGSPTSWTEVWTMAKISDSNMPRRNAINVWTGSNEFVSGIDLRAIDSQVVRVVLPTGVIRGTHDGDGVTPRSTIWHGGDGGGPAILQSPSRGQIGHLSIANTGSDGLFDHATDTQPYFLDWGSDGLRVNKILSLGMLPPSAVNTEDGGFVYVEGTYTLPIPGPGKILIVSGSAPFGAPITNNIQVPTAVTLSYMSNANSQTTKVAGDTVPINGRAVMLFGQSTTEWRIVGAF